MHGFIEANFEEIFETHYEPICYFLNLYTKDKVVIEDTAQDVFCTLWTNRDSVQASNIKSYLYAVARNRMLNYLRDIKLHEQLLSSWMDDENNLAKAYECVDEIEFEKCVEKAIENLSPKCRHVFLLSKYNKMSYKEIAKRENISEKMVEKHISTAMKKIKDFILRSMPSYLL